MIDRMKELLKTRDMCVLATCSDNKPHCSLMGYITDEPIERVYLVTLKSTRKYRNLMQNSQVSLLVDTRSEHGGLRENIQALTVSGTCAPVDEGEHKDAVFRRFSRAHPHLSGLLNDPDMVLLCLRIESFLLLQGPLEAHFVQVPPPY